MLASGVCESSSLAPLGHPGVADLRIDLTDTGQVSRGTTLSSTSRRSRRSWYGPTTRPSESTRLARTTSSTRRRRDRSRPAPAFGAATSLPTSMLVTWDTWSTAAWEPMASATRSSTSPTTICRSARRATRCMNVSTPMCPVVRDGSRRDVLRQRQGQAPRRIRSEPLMAQRTRQLLTHAENAPSTTWEESSAARRRNVAPYRSGRTAVKTVRMLIPGALITVPSPWLSGSPTELTDRLRHPPFQRHRGNSTLTHSVGHQSVDRCACRLGREC